MAAEDLLAVVGTPAAVGGGTVPDCAGCADRDVQLAAALRLAYTDELTRLPNRRTLYAVLEERAAAGFGYALLFLDLDRFKAINDQLGHETGDWVLFEFAARLRLLVVDNQGWFAARLGGDEFAVVLPAMTAEDVLAAAYLVHERTGEPMIVSGHQIFPWATVGVAVAQAGETASAVRRRADVAMYRAKRADAGVAVSDPVTDAAAAEPDQRPAAKLRQLAAMDPDRAVAA